MQVDASVDHRLFTENGHEQIKKDYEDTKDGATALIRPIDKRIDGFDTREADRAREKIRSELATKYSPEVVDYILAEGEASGLFTNIGKINSGFYNSEDKSLDNLINLSLTGIIDKNPYKKIEAPAGPSDVNISDIKDTSLGAAVVNVNASLKRIVDNAPDDKKAAASDIYTLVTGGPMGFVTGKAIEQGVKLLPNPVLQTIGQTSEDINNYLGVAGTGVLLGLSPDQIKASQESGNKQTEDRVEGTAMVGGAALDVTLGVVTAGIALGVTKAKKAKVSSQNGNAEARDSSNLNIESKCNGEQCNELKSQGKNNPYTGGAHKETSQPVGDGLDSHHCPAKTCYKNAPISSQDGPAIKMEPGDHRQTASYGGSPEAKAYRERQKELVDQGRVREAMQMEIDDLRSKFGGKYDSAIKEMESYLNTLNPQDFINQ